MALNSSSFCLHLPSAKITGCLVLCGDENGIQGLYVLGKHPAKRVLTSAESCSFFYSQCFLLIAFAVPPAFSGFFSDIVLQFVMCVMT